MTEQYTCSVCQGTFKKGWSDEEARQERSEIFGEWKDEDCDLVCDDCFQKIKPISYEELRAKTRKNMADIYRAQRKRNPAIARMVWKMEKELQKQLTDAILHGTYTKVFDDGSVEHIGLDRLLNDHT